jgi:hypothetical protein
MILKSEFRLIFNTYSCVRKAKLASDNQNLGPATWIWEGFGGNIQFSPLSSQMTKPKSRKRDTLPKAMQ